MMVTPFVFSISGLLMGILHAHQLFLLPSIAISMNNIGLMIGALVIAPMLPPDPGVAQVGDANVYGLAYGAVLSAVLHLLVQLPGLRRINARLRPLVNWRIPGVWDVLALMGPRVLGLAVVRVNFIVNAAFTSGMVSGSAAAPDHSIHADVLRAGRDRPEPGVGGVPVTLGAGGRKRNGRVQKTGWQAPYAACCSWLSRR